jgi:hypothetical protein
VAPGDPDKNSGGENEKGDRNGGAWMAQPFFAPRPPGFSQIHGARDEYYPKGRLTTLRSASPDGQIVVAVKLPKPIDESWLPGFGHSGNGDDVTHWEEIYKVRFQGGRNADVLTIAWEYSSRTRKILFAGKQFDLPDGKLAILGYSKDMKPICEIRENSRAVVEKLHFRRSSSNRRAHGSIIRRG